MPALPRRKSVAVNIGGVYVGGSHPIVVQSMTNTDTADTSATVNQIMELARAGLSWFGLLLIPKKQRKLCRRSLRHSGFSA